MKRSTFVVTAFAAFLLVSYYTCGRVYAASDEASGAKRARAAAAFAGRVVRVDDASETFSVKAKGAVVTFDASSPVFKGYKALADMRVGDLVAVSYIEDGISVMRQAGVRREPSAVVLPKGRAASWTKSLRRLRRLSGGPFDDADANKDGRITPVELSAVIPGLTLDLFRQHDANADGYLNRAEFAQTMKQQRAAKAR